MEKQCIKCKLVKNIDSFSKDSNKKDGLMGRCRVCISLYQKQWTTANKEHVKNKNAEWHELNRKRANAVRRKYYISNKEKILKKNRQKYAENPNYFKDIDLKKVYGITLEQYDQMLNTQNHACAICKKHKNEFAKALAVDHCHDTGKVRGLLCTNCNRALGNLKDSIDSAINAVAYLKAYNL